MQYKVAILVQFTPDEWLDITNITVSNNQEYARKHRYSFIPEIFEPPYSGYNKLTTILALFDYGVDVVWSIDADVLITNHNYKIEEYLNEEASFYITKDFNNYNAGSFIVKKSEWSISFLEWLLLCKGKDKMYCEQDAFVLYSKLFPHAIGKQICVLPHPSINSYLYENYPEIPMQSHGNGQWQEGDFVLHLPAIGMNKRLEILKNTKVIK